MKKQNWTCWAVATALIFGGVFLGCGINDRPDQKKQDGLPVVATDNIPGDPTTVQKSKSDAAPANPASDFEYTKSDSEVTITKLKNIQMRGKVVIPRTIDGLPVTSIGVGAFKSCKNLTIRTPKGFAAEKYAEGAGIKFETTASSSR